jgi:hypothetical protein
LKSAVNPEIESECTGKKNFDTLPHPWLCFLPTVRSRNSRVGGWELKPTHYRSNIHDRHLNYRAGDTKMSFTHFCSLRSKLVN